MTDDELINLVGQLSNAYGPSGFEDEVVSALKAAAASWGVLTEDHLRNLLITPIADQSVDSATNSQSAIPAADSRQRQRPVLLLEAHSDEVGLMVQSINSDGTLNFLPLGRWTPSALPAQLVRVRNREGQWLRGITTTIPPHYQSALGPTEAGLNPASLTIDVGAHNRWEVEESWGVQIGQPVVPDVVFNYDSAHDLGLGKALDNRLGCAALLASFSALQETPSACQILGAWCAQEEVGSRGAAVLAQRIAPDLAIVLEGCPADDSFGSVVAHPQTILGDGPMLRHLDNGMITNPRFQRWTLDLAQELGIPIQEAVRSGGSTDGEMIQRSPLAPPTIVIGIPVRYAHSPVGYFQLRDLKQAVQLVVAAAQHLDAATLADF